MAGSASPRAPDRITHLARRDNELRELEGRVRATPAAGAGPELAAKRDDLLRRVGEAQQRVGEELADRRELAGMARDGQTAWANWDAESDPARKADRAAKLEKAKSDFAKKKAELKEKYAKKAQKGSKDAEDPCVDCLEEDAKKLEAETDPETQEKMGLARELCDVRGSADEADKELVAKELAKMPREDLERMKANGTRVAVCRGAVTDYKPDLASSEPRGWKKGTKWSEVPGCYDDRSNEVIVATRGHEAGEARVPRTGEGHGSANLAVHEAYHGLDYKTGKPSSGADFAGVRRAAPNELSDYMSQSGQAGEEESFAESAARRYGSPAEAASDQPNLDDYWRSDPLGRTAGGGAK